MATATLLDVATPGPALGLSAIAGMTSVGQAACNTGLQASATSGTWANIASISLTPGKWLVLGKLLAENGSGITITGGTLSLVSAATVSSWPTQGPVGNGGASSTPYIVAAVITVTVTTTVYLNFKPSGTLGNSIYAFLDGIQIG